MPQLSPEQERDLVIAAESGGTSASRKLVDAFLPSIAGVARRFPTGAGVEREELLQEGVAGLLTAVRRYDSTSDGLPRAGDEERPLSDAWWPEHWAEDCRGSRAESAGALETRVAFAGTPNTPGGESTAMARALGAAQIGPQNAAAHGVHR